MAVRDGWKREEVGGYTRDVNGFVINEKRRDERRRESARDQKR